MNFDKPKCLVLNEISNFSGQLYNYEPNILFVAKNA